MKRETFSIGGADLRVPIVHVVTYPEQKSKRKEHNEILSNNVYLNVSRPFCSGK